MAAECCENPALAYNVCDNLMYHCRKTQLIVANIPLTLVGLKTAAQGYRMLNEHPATQRLKICQQKPRKYSPPNFPSPL